MASKMITNNNHGAPPLGIYSNPCKYYMRVIIIEDSPLPHLLLESTGYMDILST